MPCHGDFAQMAQRTASAASGSSLRAGLRPRALGAGLGSAERKLAFDGTGKPDVVRERPACLGASFSTGSRLCGLTLLLRESCLMSPPAPPCALWKAARLNASPVNCAVRGRGGLGGEPDRLPVRESEAPRTLPLLRDGRMPRMGEALPLLARLRGLGKADVTRRVGEGGAPQAGGGARVGEPVR